MNIVKFPGFNLELNVPKYLIQFGNIKIYMYAFCIVLGIIIGLILAKISKEKFGIKYDTVLEIVIGSIIFGTIGARLYYVIFNLSEYLKEPLKIFDINSGGLAIYGGIIGILIFIFIKCKKDKISFLDVCDYLVPYLALGQAIGRFGNFFNIEAYGRPTDSIFRMGIYVESRIYRSSASIFVRINLQFYYFYNFKNIAERKKISRSNFVFIFYNVWFYKNANRAFENW